MYENEMGLRTAERELAAFYTAVLKTYGPEEAKAAASDWIEVLETVDCEPCAESEDWRPVTIAAASCLAARITNAAATA
ncbi:MAG TPA: hypothetical protein VGG18_15760 [Granulicella sp.]|jgi:hypothetical protein